MIWFFVVAGVVLVVVIAWSSSARPPTTWPVCRASRCSTSPRRSTGWPTVFRPRWPRSSATTTFAGSSSGTSTTSTSSRCRCATWTPSSRTELVVAEEDDAVVHALAMRRRRGDRDRIPSTSPSSSIWRRDTSGPSARSAVSPRPRRLSRAPRGSIDSAGAVDDERAGDDLRRRMPEPGAVTFRSSGAEPPQVRTRVPPGSITGGAVLVTGPQPGSMTSDVGDAARCSYWRR